MRILFYNFGSFTFTDINEYLTDSGHNVHHFFYPIKDRFNDPDFCEKLDEAIKSGPFDLFFSVNFFPLMAKRANELGVPYLSWSYDSPLSEDLVKFFDYPTNIICLFDRNEVMKFNHEGHKNVFHIPLAVNTRRLSQAITAQSTRVFTSDISFVGDLHNSPLNTLLNSMGDFNRGYISALMNAQLDLYGLDLVSPSISEDFMKGVNNDLSLAGIKTSLSKTGLSFSILKELTHIDRISLIEAIADKCRFNLYSYDKYGFISPVNLCGPVSYRDEMPLVFNKSRINLCPTLRSITSGIPLRALDILGCKGVLLSNYQEELVEEFEDGKDCIIYTSIEEAVEKALFYLKDDNKLAEIRNEGFKKVSILHSYEAIMPKLFETVRLNQS